MNMLVGDPESTLKRGPDDAVARVLLERTPGQGLRGPPRRTWTERERYVHRSGPEAFAQGECLDTRLHWLSLASGAPPSVHAAPHFCIFASPLFNPKDGVDLARETTAIVLAHAAGGGQSSRRRSRE